MNTETASPTIEQLEKLLAEADTTTLSTAFAEGDRWSVQPEDDGRGGSSFVSVAGDDGLTFCLVPENGWPIGDRPVVQRAALIVAAVNSLPSLIAQIKELREALEKIRDHPKAAAFGPASEGLRSQTSAHNTGMEWLQRIARQALGAPK